MNSQIRLAAAAGVCALAMTLGACGGDDDVASRPAGDTSSTSSETDQDTEVAGDSPGSCHEDPPDGTSPDDWHLRCLAGEWQYAADDAESAVQATMTIDRGGNMMFEPDGGGTVYEGMLDPEGMTVELLPVEGDQIAEGESQFFELTWMDDSYDALIVKGGGNPMKFTRVA